MGEDTVIGISGDKLVVCRENVGYESVDLFINRADDGKSRGAREVSWF